MKNVTYKGFLITFEKQYNGSILAFGIGDTDTVKQVFYGYSLKSIRYTMYELIDAYYDEKGDIKAHREPTKAEIKFGYGAIHYASFSRSQCIGKNGKIKRWFKNHRDNLTYSTR